MVSEENPEYRAVQESAGSFFMIVVDEGWRESIVCSGMYAWSAKWLVDVLQGKPFAPETRPS